MDSNFHEILGRTFGFSNIDTFGTIFFAYLYSVSKKTNLLKTIILFLILGEIVHYLLKIQTPFLSAIGVKVI